MTGAGGFLMLVRVPGAWQRVWACGVQAFKLPGLPELRWAQWQVSVQQS